MSEGRTLFLRLSRGERAVTLRLYRDEERARRAFAHGGGYGLDHVERTPGDELLPALGALGQALARLREPSPWSARLVPTLVAVLRHVDARASLVPHRLLLDAQRVPQWSAAMRSGVPREGSLWPYDGELAALEAGARALVRREWGASEDAARERDTCALERRGLHTQVEGKGDGSGRVVVLAAREAQTLADASGRERAVEVDAAGWEDAASAMGRALGYPPCCVAAFVRGRARHDAVLMAERLPEVRHDALGPESLWLDGALALVSHVPCAPACTATRALARRVLEALDGASPGFAVRWRERAARVQLLTPEGRMFALRTTGALADGVVEEACELVPDGEAPRWVALPEARGVALVIDGLWLGCPALPWLRGTLFADHRGEPA